jgi:capsular polysaccharide biosynthesis protein
VSVESLRARWFKDVVAVPSNACLYRRDGSLIDDSVHRRNGLMLGPPPRRITIPSQLNRIDQPVVYGGFLPKHFGHFLLESLVRTWVFPLCDPGPLPFVHFRHRFHLHEVDLLDAVIGKSGSMLQQVTEPTVLEEVLIPDQGIDIGGVYHPEMRTVFDAIRDTLVGRPAEPSEVPVYLSRAHLGPENRSTLGERALEHRLTGHGIRVIHPEELPLREQITVVSDALSVIGLYGTALHLTLFRHLADARTIVLGPRQPHDPQQRVDRLRGADHRHLRVQYPLHPRFPSLFGGRALEIGRYRNFVIPALAENRILQAL